MNKGYKHTDKDPETVKQRVIYTHKVLLFSKISVSDESIVIRKIGFVEVGNEIGSSIIYKPIGVKIIINKQEIDN